MADTWGTSWNGTWALSWARGVTPPAPTPAAEVGGGRGTRTRRRLIIDDVIYEGTEEQLHERLLEILAQQQEKPKPKKAKAKRHVVELKREPIYIPPFQIYMPRFQMLVAESRRHEDAFMEAMLNRILRRYLEDEDDTEVLLLLH